MLLAFSYKHINNIEILVHQNNFVILRCATDILTNDIKFDVLTVSLMLSEITKIHKSKC